MQTSPHSRLEIPESLRQKLLGFRRRLWRVKLIEAVAGAVIGVLVGYLLTYAIDRWIDTPRLVRWAIFGGAILACSLVPLAVDRWVYRQRRLDQLAKLLSHKHPSVGDQLLGIIELAGSETEQERVPRIGEGRDPAGLRRRRAAGLLRCGPASQAQAALRGRRRPSPARPSCCWL